MEHINKLKRIKNMIENYLDENPDGGSDLTYHRFQLSLCRILELPKLGRVYDLESDIDEALSDLKALEEEMGWK